MAAHSENFDFVLEPADISRLVKLCGPLNEHLHQLEETLGVRIRNRGNHFSIFGEGEMKRDAARIIRELYDLTNDKEELTSSSVHLHVIAALDKASSDASANQLDVTIRACCGNVHANGRHQVEYLKNISRYDLTFGVGPAGTGKTYLAVAAAVAALLETKVNRLILVRPAVEAGERLGFLPGDMSQKIDPYLRPMYDALYTILSVDRVNKLIDRGEIEIAPLAYMRGRSLNDAFIILDESQNTTVEQMKMFLTRIGFGSKAVVTGDVTQVDLSHDKQSGLEHALNILRDIRGIGFSFFDAGDVMRHRLVKEIIRAYQHHNDKDKHCSSNSNR